MKGDDKTFDSFIPNSESDITEYAALICTKLLQPYEKSTHYITLVKLLTKVSVTSLNVADAIDFVSFANGIAYAKLKAEEYAAGTKKKRGGKVMVNKADDFDVEDGCAGHDEDKATVVQSPPITTPMPTVEKAPKKSTAKPTQGLWKELIIKVQPNFLPQRRVTARPLAVFFQIQKVTSQNMQHLFLLDFYNHMRKALIIIAW